MTFENSAKKYLRALETEYRKALADEQHTAELSFRAILHAFLQDLAASYLGESKATIVLEPKKQKNAGRPDWRIHDASTLAIFGYVEAKGLSLDKFCFEEHLEQFCRYLTLGQKLVITDGIEFAYQFPGDSSVTVASIIDKKSLSREDWASNPINPEFWIFAQKLFETPHATNHNDEDLIRQIAIRARYLAENLETYCKIPLEEALDTYERQGIQAVEDLRNLYCGDSTFGFFQTSAFAEHIAQGIAFDLLQAHRALCAPKGSPSEREQILTAYTSRANDEAVHNLTFHAWSTGPNFISAWIQETIQYLSFVQIAEESQIDPGYRELFQLFFSQFSESAQREYGTFFTPEPVASCLVSFTNIALKLLTGKTLTQNGSGKILDPCCGTGTILDSAIRSGIPIDQVAGFEILPAPFILANHRLLNNKRNNPKHLRPSLFLVNSLGDDLRSTKHSAETTLREAEVRRASAFLRDSKITAIISNPPCVEAYQAATKEGNALIDKQIDDFRAKKSRSKNNLERQINNAWLQFLRLSCSLIKGNDSPSVVAMLLPSSILEHDSFRMAREYILHYFTDIFVLEIDGATRSGIQVENIFPTQQGRSIVVAVRTEPRNTIANVRHASIVYRERSEKNAFLSAFSIKELEKFTPITPTPESSFSLCPVKTFDRKTYPAYWPLKSTEEPAIFKKDISGIKLSPISLLVHAKKSMLRRRTREVAHDISLSKEWFSGWDRPPQQGTLSQFSAFWNRDKAEQDAMLDSAVRKYALRPFLTASALLDEDLAHELARVGGGGTRLRPDLYHAFSKNGTLGIAVSPSPKDQRETLGQFSSFCWYYPDNDLCRRGSSRIFCNRLANRKTGELEDNITDDIALSLLREFGYSGERPFRDTVVFYSYAILCCPLYLNAFEGALFTVTRPDQSPRIPVVAVRSKYDEIVNLGEKLANLERDDHEPGNILYFDYAALLSSLPKSFKLQLTDNIFDPDTETIILSSLSKDKVFVPCPSKIFNINIGGYDIIKNAWLKFYSYDYTHCEFTESDFDAFLCLLNRLAEYLNLLEQLNIVVGEVCTH